MVAVPPAAVSKDRLSSKSPRQPIHKRRLFLDLQEPLCVSGQSWKEPSLLSGPSTEHLKWALLWVPPVLQVASSGRIGTPHSQPPMGTASAPSIQGAGVLIALLSTHFGPGPSPLQSPHPRCQNHGSEKTSTLHSRHVHSNSRCRERKERKCIFSHIIVEM